MRLDVSSNGGLQCLAESTCILDCSIICTGGSVGRDIIVGDDLVVTEDVFPIHVGDASPRFIPMYLFSSRFDCGE